MKRLVLANISDDRTGRQGHLVDGMPAQRVNELLQGQQQVPEDRIGE